MMVRKSHRMRRPLAEAAHTGARASGVRAPAGDGREEFQFNAGAQRAGLLVCLQRFENEHRRGRLGRHRRILHVLMEGFVISEAPPSRPNPRFPTTRRHQ